MMKTLMSTAEITSRASGMTTRINIQYSGSKELLHMYCIIYSRPVNFQRSHAMKILKSRVERFKQLRRDMSIGFTARLQLDSK